MSKNKQMHSEPAVIGRHHPTSGAVSLAQGVYGTHGNLELVACDAADGLWVFWFNADLEVDPAESPEVAPGQWSDGLHFAHGGRYLDAQILQSTLGPDHLEVLALDARGVLQSWYWSPGPGFQRRRADAASGVARFGVDHHDGTLRVTMVHHDGAIRHLRSTATGYPRRLWTEAPNGPGLPDEQAARRLVERAGVDLDEVAEGTARMALSTRNGGTTELVWRDRARRIRHLGVPTAARTG